MTAKIKVTVIVITFSFFLIIERTQEFTAPAYESTEEEASPLMLRYQEAITTTDTYHETKRSFAWIGEIEEVNLLAALEQLSDSDLELITLYAYEEYDTVEISKLFGTTKQNISKKIRRITNFIDVYRGYQIHVDFNFDLAQYLENSDELAC